MSPGARACIYLQDPTSSYTVDVGSYVAVRMGMENCGDVSGNFYGEIFKNGSRCVGKWNEILEPGGVLKFFGSECDITSMPNSTVNIKFCGGHAEGGVWHQDFVKYITLTPEAPPTICDQPVRVVDENDVKIDNARVDCYEGGSFKAHCTTYYGDCLLSFLDIGTRYKAVASKSGYECLNCEKYFTACTSQITLSLRTKPTTCNQSFIVKDTDGNTVTKNCIIVVRDGSAWINECATSTSGTCAVGLTQGSYLRACVEQVPSGYELISGSCRNFTACTSRITLTIQKSCVCGDWVDRECVDDTHRRQTRTCTPSGCDTEERVVYDPSCAPPTCNQQFALVDADTGEYITGATVKVGGAGCTEYSGIERYQIDGLIEGLWYNVVASKAGYACPSDICKDTFEACGLAIVLKLKSEVVTCDQLVKVVNPALEPIEGASVVVPISETESALCYTDADGFCYIRKLTIGSMYTVCASKAGYEQYGNDGCKGFTACSPYAVLLTLHKPCEQGFGVRDQDNNPIEDATVTVTGSDTCTTDANGCCSIVLDADLSYDAEATKDGYVCYNSKCRQENFVCVPDSSLPLYLEAPAIIDNYDIVFCVGKSIWGFDWIANKFVSKILPKITDTLNSLGISGLVVHGGASRYDAEKKQIIVNVDIPSHSPIAPLVIFLILSLLPVLIWLGIYIKDMFFDKKGAEAVTVTLRTIDTDSNLITEPISLTVNGVTKTTSAGVASFGVTENFQIQCESEDWDIFDSTKWYDPTTAPQDVVLSTTATRDVKILVTDAAGNPLPNKEVHILDANGKFIRTATTDENGYVTLDMGAGEYLIVVTNELGIPVGTASIPPGTYNRDEEIVVPEGFALRVYAREEGTSVYVGGATITMNGKTETTDGKYGALFTELEDKEYAITAQHPSYNNGDIVTYPEMVNPTSVLEDIIVDMVHTAEDALVRIYPRYGAVDLIGAKVKLEGFGEKTTTELGFVEYTNVPYGSYKVAVTAQDFTQKESNKEYPVDESHTTEGVVTIIVDMESGITPPPPPSDVKKALIYGVLAIGTYASGSIIKGVSPKAKTVGTALKIGTAAPAGLCAWEAYKIIKEKYPLI